MHMKATPAKELTAMTSSCYEQIIITTRTFNVIEFIEKIMTQAFSKRYRQN